MVSRLANFCKNIGRLNGEKYLLFRSDEQELKRTVCSIIVHLSLQSTTRLDKIVVVTETDRRARALFECLTSHGLGPDFSSCFVGNPGELLLCTTNRQVPSGGRVQLLSNKVLVCRAENFFRLCLTDRWLTIPGTDPSRMLVVYIDVTLNTLVIQKENNAEGWDQAAKFTSVLATCGRIKREFHERLLGWKFAQADMDPEDGGRSGRAGCPEFMSVLTRGPNKKELDYCKPESLDSALVETVEVIKSAGSLIDRGGIVVIGSGKGVVIRLAERLESSRAHRALDIEAEHVFCPQRQDAADPDGRGVASTLKGFDRVAGAAEKKALLLISLRAVQHFDIIESTFKHAKLIFFVGLPFTHQRHWPFDLKLYATFDLMNSLLRELFAMCRETPDCKALIIMDKHMTPERKDMLPSELRDIEFEDFFSMRIRLGEFLQHYQLFLAIMAVQLRRRLSVF
jgi:hypothetical protein